MLKKSMQTPEQQTIKTVISKLGEVHEKTFCKPITYRYGKHFKNKSEERRHQETVSEVLKLKHMLLVDGQGAYGYVKKVSQKRGRLERRCVVFVAVSSSR